MKKTLTYTIISGNMLCPNNCPVCISKMTPDYDISGIEPEFHNNIFRDATKIALNHGAEIALITGKGEPTLFPGLVSKYLFEMAEAERKYGRFFDRKELQTSGSLLIQENNIDVGWLYDEFLGVWKTLGLDLIAISIYHYFDWSNQELFRPRNDKWYDLSELIKKLHSKGFKIRLSCLMLKGYIDSVEEVKNLLKFAKENNVFQLTLRTADRPDNPRNKRIAKFVDENRIGYNDSEYKEIVEFLGREGKLCDILPHGAHVYEVDGQNIGITTGLTNDVGEKEIRQLIYFPQGWLTTSWENVQGGRIL